MNSAIGSLRTTLSTVLKHDLLASVVVFLVALPLCMGIAIASGAPVAAGLITGIVGGLVAGMLAGSPLQVSGPAAGLTVVVFDVIQRFGLEMMGLVVLVAGAMQCAAGLLGLAPWFRAVSPAVIKGMLTGIGVLIFASQFHVMVDDAPKGSGIANLASIPEALRKGLTATEFAERDVREFRTGALKQVGEIHRRQEALSAGVSKAIVGRRPVASEDTAPAAHLEAVDSQVAALAGEQEAIVESLEGLVKKLSHSAQTSRVAHADRIAAAAASASEALHEALDDLRAGQAGYVHGTQTHAVAALADLQGSLKNHSLAAQIGLLTIVFILLWQGLVPRRFRVVPAPLIAVVAATALAGAICLPVLYVEVPDNPLSDLRMPTLSIIREAPWGRIVGAAVVVAVVASAETLLCAVAVDQMHTGPRTKFDRELTAQGAGNMVCGVLGALPMTGVIVRSAANVQAGARTRWSAVLHGAWLIVFISALSFLLRMVPTASLAAILVYTGYKLINAKVIKELWHYGKGEALIYVATVGVIVVEDLLSGVLTGVVLSGVKLLYTFSHLKLHLKIDEELCRSTLSLEGAATFIRLPKLAATLDEVPPSTELHVDLTHLQYIDHACLDLLMSWARQHESTSGKLVMDWDSMHAKFRRDKNASSATLRRTA